MTPASGLRYPLTKLAGAGGRGSVVLTVGHLLLAFSLWVQSDAYRYAALVLVIFGALHFFLVERRELRIGWLDIACYVWALHVALRYAALLALHPEASGGQAEGIYVFVALYPTVGYTLFLNRERAQLTIRLFMAASLVFLLADATIAFSGGRWNPDVGLHSNRVHAALAAGFVLLAAFARLAWLFQADRWRAKGGRAEIILAVALSAVAALLVFGRISKGVWLALAIALPVMAIFILIRANRAGRIAVLAGALVLAVLVAANLDFLLRIGGPTLEGVARSLELLSQGRGFSDATADLVAGGTLPLTLAQRLELWSNALEIWARDPWFGVGATWEDLWSGVRFADSAFNDNVHNGFLETGMRFGLVGLAFYALLYGVLGASVVSAGRRGLIHPVGVALWFSSLLYFLVTLLSNSNERLPHGESFMLVLAAVGFWMRFALQEKPGARPAEAPASAQGAVS